MKKVENRIKKTYCRTSNILHYEFFLEREMKKMMTSSRKGSDQQLRIIRVRGKVTKMAKNDSIVVERSYTSCFTHFSILFCVGMPSYSLAYLHIL